nr:unnamed protein product [Callosobruchus analis]
MQILLDHLKNSGDKAKYISPMIQNQIFEILNDAEGFVIISDETAGITNKEQLTICARYLKQQNQICERFLQFVEITSATGANIAENI